jgi:protein-S-isoprenylcysteine O-methyltransferase Ste14
MMLGSLSVVVYALALVTTIALTFLDAALALRPYLIVRWLGMAIGVSGLSLACWTVATMRRGILGAIKPVAGGVMRSGPYRYVRHPLYVGIALGLIGLALGRGSTWGSAAAVLIFVPSAVVRALREERAMAQAFGPDWDAYRRRVGFMFPHQRR